MLKIQDWYSFLSQIYGRDIKLTSDVSIEWNLYKYSPVIQSNIATFSKTKNFCDNNKCKIIISFDSTTEQRSLIRDFIEQSPEHRNLIKNFLFDNNPNIEFYICQNNQNVFFYYRDRLQLLLKILNRFKIKGINWTRDLLLELPCTWIKERDKIENGIIHILFGSTDLCGWISNADTDDRLKHREFTDNLKDAYLEYMELIDW